MPILIFAKPMTVNLPGNFNYPRTHSIYPDRLHNKRCGGSVGEKKKKKKVPRAARPIITWLPFPARIAPADDCKAKMQIIGAAGTMTTTTATTLYDITLKFKGDSLDFPGMFNVQLII